MKFSIYILSGAAASNIPLPITPTLTELCKVSLIDACTEDAKKFEYAASLVSTPQEIQYLCHYVKVYNHGLAGFKASAITGLEKTIITEITVRNEISQFAPKISQMCTSFQLIGRLRKFIDFAENIANLVSGDSAAATSSLGVSLCQILEQSLTESDFKTDLRLTQLKDNLVARYVSQSSLCSVDHTELPGATEEDIFAIQEIRSGLGSSFDGKRKLCRIIALFKFGDKESGRKNLQQLLVSARGRIAALPIAPKIANDCFLTVDLGTIPTFILLKAEEAFVNGVGDESNEICQVLNFYTEKETSFIVESLIALKSRLESYSLARGSF